MERGEEVLEVVQTNQKGFKGECQQCPKLQRRKNKDCKTLVEFFPWKSDALRGEQQDAIRFPLPHFHLGT